jgi:hypothetical protein
MVTKCTRKLQVKSVAQCSVLKITTAAIKQGNNKVNQLQRRNTQQGKQCKTCTEKVLVYRGNTNALKHFVGKQRKRYVTNNVQVNFVW